MVEFGRIISQGRPIYSGISDGPYYFIPYMPLFLVVQGWGMKFFQDPWFFGRCLALVGYLGCAVLLGAWGFRRWNFWATSVLVFLFLLSPTCAAWGSTVRADTTYLFIHFSAFLILAKVSEKEEGKKKGRTNAAALMAAGFLTAIAILVKQTAVTLIVAYFFYACLKKRWQNLFFFLPCALVPVVMTVLYLQLSSAGIFLKDTFFWAPFGYDFHLLRFFLVRSFWPECGWLAAAVLLTFLHGRASDWPKFQVVFSVFWLLGLGRLTSAENYYMEFILYGIYFLGEGWFRKTKTDSFKIRTKGRGETFKKDRIISRWAIIGLMGIGFVSLSFLPWPAPPSPEVCEMKRESLKFFQIPGDYLALDMDLPLMAGRRIWIPPLAFTHLVQKGLWSPDPLIQDIKNHKFKLIELYDIPQQYLLPPLVDGEIQKDYRVISNQYGRRWYVPRRVNLKNPTS